jgi:hypothetical protein
MRGEWDCGGGSAKPRWLPGRPRTIEHKATSLSNLPPYQQLPHLHEIKHHTLQRWPPQSPRRHSQQARPRFVHRNRRAGPACPTRRTRSHSCPRWTSTSMTCGNAWPTSRSNSMHLLSEAGRECWKNETSSARGWASCMVSWGRLDRLYRANH